RICSIDSAPPPVGSTLKLRLTVTLALLMLVVVFLVQNAAMVEIRFLFWEFAMPRSLLVILMLLNGIVIGWFMRAMYRLSRATQD
ncbi:MAG: LapA family protein, partial [Pseudomonadota bacterium]